MGCKLYPLPLFVKARLSTPPVAIAVAATVAPPPEMTTAGAVYPAPDPPASTVIAFTIPE